MKKMKKTSTKIISFMLALFLAFSYCISVSGEYYMDSHPHAVNENMTAAEVEEKDLESFKNVSGFDYHDAKKDDYAPNELIVQISSAKNTAKAAISSLKSEYSLYSGHILRAKEYSEENSTFISSAGKETNIVYTCHFLTEEDDIISLCDRLREDESVVYAQPNFKYYTCDDKTVNMAADSQAESFTEPTAFSTTTYQDKLKWWFDYCNISSAWENYADSSTGYGMGKGINVAVIDTGCNTAHEDIKANLWSHPNNSNVCGYYAYQSTKTGSDVYVTKNGQFDQNGHGSHCCGTIAMNGDNSVGGIGTAPKCKIMVMKADRGDGSGSFYGDEIITSLQKSKEFGADIISMSLGGYNFDYSLYQTYQEVSSSCLIVCAAGNEHFDTTEKLHFPSAASCNMGVMAMNASTSSPSLATFSNYDTTGNFYKIVAPGTAIYSLDYSGNDTYKNLQGTSMATPAVAGMIASYMSYIKYVKGYNWTPAQYQYRIENTLNSSSNPLQIGAYSSYYHPVAHKLNSKFKVCNLNQLLSSGSGAFSTPSKTSFNNSVIKQGVLNATGLSENEINSYVLRRLALLQWGDKYNTPLRTVTDFSDLSKLTGLNYLDLNSCTGVTQSNLESVISSLPATLVHLDLRVTASLTDISCIANSKFNCMHELNISGNSIENIGAIAKLTSLKYLYAQNNKIKDISALYGMTHLEKINLSGNLIEDPNPAFASKFLYDIDLSSNKISDYNQLYNYKGAFYSSDFYAKTINFNVSSNYMNNLSATVANKIISAIRTNNTVGGKTYVETINFTYNNQSTATLVPMTKFRLSDKTVSREQFCSGNLNLNAISGFTAYPSNANQYNYLTWSCSEDGYCAPDGSITVSPEQITSTRTLTFTGTATEASGATSYATDEKSQTVKITITAPEIYNAYLSERVAATGTQIALIVSTNKYASTLVLRSGTTASATTYTSYNLTTAANKNELASGECYEYLFALPSSIYNTAGTYPLYLFAADSTGTYTTSTSADISGNTAYAYKNIGPLYIKDSVAYSSNISIAADKTVNRYGQAPIFSVNAGTSSTSPARISGTYSVNFSPFRYLGTGAYYTSYALGFNGREATGYPSATTGKSTLTLTVDDENSATAEISTVAPEVTVVNTRNKTSYKTDGYIEYLVKTNTAATGVKVVDPVTKEEKTADVDHILTTTGSATGTYGVYNSSNCYKLWVMRVPLKSDGKTIDAVTITAYDPLGNGSVTKTPATSVKAGPVQKVYISSKYKYKNFNNGLTFYPVDESGNSLADCCKSVTFSISNTNYFYRNSETSGLVYCNYDNIINNCKSEYASVKVTVTLETGATNFTYLYAYLPYIDEVNYDKTNSVMTTGGTVYYTAKTYGIDTLYIKNDSSLYTAPAQVLTLENTDAYTKETDENGDEYILWNFERVFGENELLTTYLTGSYKYSDEVTANTSDYTEISTAQEYKIGDYSAWNAQLERLKEEKLEALKQAYGDDVTKYNENVEILNDFIDSAILDYHDTQQENINAQTEQLKDIIDNLFGYGEYNEALADYNSIDDSIYYIPDELRELVGSEINDGNAKTVANRINFYLENLELLADTSAWENALASIPENYSQVFKEGENHFVYLKTDIDSIDELRQVEFINPLPASRQAEIDAATASLIQAISDLQAHRMDVTALVNLVNNKEKYCEKISAYTLPDNLASDYLNKINAVDFFALTSQENVSEVYNDINATTESIDEFCEAVDALKEYVEFLKNNVKDISLKATSPYYSDGTYSPLKMKFDDTLSKLADKNAGYTSLQALIDDLASLQELYSDLHTHNFVLSIAETCTYKYMQCECGELVKVPYGADEGEHSHNLSSLMSTAVELCDGTQAVIEYKICETCGAVEYVSGEEYISSHEHSWVLKENADVSPEILALSAGIDSKQPTCTNSGCAVYICENCGLFKTEDIAPLGHSFTGEWYVFKQPTETEEGEKRCKCDRCDEYISESIAVLPPRAEIIIPFSAEVSGISIKAYQSGVKPPYAEPLYVFREQPDESGYKIEIDLENKIYKIRLPLNCTYDLVIQKDGYTPYSIYSLEVGSADIDLRDYNENENKVMTLLYAGDFNADGKVNALDKILLNAYIGSAAQNKNKIYDLDGNGVINNADKALMLRDYMNSEKFIFLNEN